jgi:serine protease Do
MLVLLKVDSPQPLTVPTPLSRKAMRVGQWAIALGRTFSPETPNISVGILSATNRIWGRAIQTDANVSPSNYGGPLIDIQGRVLGVLVPLSPDSQKETAGAEWYDSGIGFAIPLEEINEQLTRMQSGEDLFPGLMGVTLLPGDIYSLPAEIAAVQPNSPASDADLRVGDTIMSFDGVAIRRQSHLKHALGPQYAGETIELVVRRGEEEVKTKVELAKELVPFQHAFLGILPMRGESPPDTGVTVRYVFANSGAAAAGIIAGDRIVRWKDEEVRGGSELRRALANCAPGDRVRLVIRRGEATQKLEVDLSTLPTDVPAALPADEVPPADPAVPNPETGFIEISIPQEVNRCVAYVPRSYVPQRGHALVVHLPNPGEFDDEGFTKRWQSRCDEQGLIVLACLPRQDTAWSPVELEFLRKAVEHVLSRYTIDRARIVAHGYQAGGAMAFFLAFRQRDLIRGVASVEAVPPSRLQIPANDPLQRLAFYCAGSESFFGRSAVTDAVKVIEDAGYPVTRRPVAGRPSPLDDAQLAEVLRWIDTLDRI